MRICAISDTHNKHEDISIPAADLYICSGDFTQLGTIFEMNKFIEWFASLSRRGDKILVPGNHENIAYENPTLIKSLCRDKDIHYLDNDFVVLQNNMIYGSPYSKGRGKIFQHLDSDLLAKQWSKIPQGTDILITHGPPIMILDKSGNEMHTGCKELAEAVRMIQPKIHAFGHMHASRGVLKGEYTTYINSCICDELYEPSNLPVVIEI